MLMLSRNPGSSIILGRKDIIIKIVSVNGYQVRIGIEAPDCVSIFREEIYDKYTKNKEPSHLIFQKYD